MGIKVSRDFLEQMLEEYNNQVEPSKRLALVEQGNGQMVETKKEKVFDTKDLYVCVYDDNCVDIFKVKRLNTNGTYIDYDAYIGLFSRKVSVEAVPKYSFSSHIWQIKGFRAYGHTVTCDMTRAVGFEEFRLGLNFSGKIGKFELGKTTTSEMLEVLKLAPQYFGLTQEQDKTKEKV